MENVENPGRNEQRVKRKNRKHWGKKAGIAGTNVEQSSFAHSV